MLASTQILPLQIMLLRQVPRVLAIALATKCACFCRGMKKGRVKDIQDQNRDDSMLGAVSEKEDPKLFGIINQVTINPWENNYWTTSPMFLPGFGFSSRRFEVWHIFATTERTASFWLSWVIGELEWAWFEGGFGDFEIRGSEFWVLEGLMMISNRESWRMVSLFLFMYLSSATSFFLSFFRPFHLVYCSLPHMFSIYSWGVKWGNRYGFVSEQVWKGVARREGRKE